MLKFGVISEVYADTGLARVNWDGDSVVSFPLPMLLSKTKTEKESYPFDAGEHVVCLMDENAENGVILGAIYSTNETPVLTSADIFGIKYNNGDEFSYDRSQKTLTNKTGNTTLIQDSNHLEVTNGALTFTVNGLTGKFEMSSSGVSLKSLMNDTITQILAMTQTTPSGLTVSPPINSAAFLLIQTQLNTFFN